MVLQEMALAEVPVYRPLAAWLLLDRSLLMRMLILGAVVDFGRLV
jgi:hypothetical protein